MNRQPEVLLRIRPLIILCILVPGILFPLAAGGSGLRAAALNASTSLILVVGTYVFVGNSGIISFGQVSFAAVGAYTTALLTMPVMTKAILLPQLPPRLADVQMPFIVATVVSGLVAGLLAMVVAVALMRLSGIAAGIATFALLVIVYQVALNWTGVTGGAGTLSGIPRGLDMRVAVGWVLVAIIVAFWYQSSRWGLRLRGSREDEVAARAAGVGVEFERGVAFVVSAVMMGVAGSLYAYQQGALTPSAFYLRLTFLTLAMLVIGGMHSLSGAVVGTLLLTGVEEIFRRWATGQGVGPIDIDLPAGTSQVVIAVLMLFVILKRPEGVTAGRELGTELRGRRGWRLIGAGWLQATRRVVQSRR